MISVKSLSKKYDNVDALKDLSFEIKKGDIVGFLGPNGAGKTTLVKILTCYLPPTTGTVDIHNYSIFSDSLKIRSMIGYLPEDNPLYLNMKVKHYLNYIASLRNFDKDEIPKIIENAIKSCKLDI